MGLPSTEPIAIVGIGCRFPGGASSPSKLWDVLKDPKNLAKPIPADRFNIDRFYHPDGKHHGTTNVKETYFLDEDVRQFDSGFFGAPTGEAASIDPQHRLLLETVYESLETAGLTISGLQGSDTAVYVGLMCSDYMVLHSLDVDRVPTYNSPGIANSNASARVSYYFDWHGPCMTIDTACSSSLVAVHQAVQALRSGSSRIAIAAGTNLLFSPLGYVSESNLSMLSPTGRSRMWDADADGYARGEGVAALVLKPLSAALADGDHVECIIRETGVNQDGKTKGITMPSAAAQAALIRDTYARAGLDLNSKKHRCQYFEAHGTGTPAGDPQEAEALHTAFFGEQSHDSDDILKVGSVKTVIGHTEGTAGIAGVIKSYLAIKHGLIPPNLLFNKLSPTVEPFYKHLEVVTSLTPWPKLAPGVPRRASVNSFGFGGTNAHAIIESFGTIGQTRTSLLEPSLPTPIRSILPFTFSAASEKSLKQLLDAYQLHLSDVKDIDLRRLAYSLSSRRSHFPFKIAISASTQEELLDRINKVLASQPTFTRSTVKDATILGIFTGQGAQWPRMGQQLLETIPSAKETIANLDKALATLPSNDRPSWTIAEQLNQGQDKSRLDEAEIAQPLVAAVQILLVNLFRSAGVKFQAIVGHSSGEIAAAYASGLISDKDAIRIAYYRGFHSKKACGPTGQPGAMLAVGTSLEDAQDLCSTEDFAGRVVVAACNSSTSLTLSGDEDAIDEVQSLLEEENKFVRRLRVDKAYHSHHMKPAAEPFLTSLAACDITVLQPRSGSATWYSSVHKNTQNGVTTALDGSYWVENLNSAVLFSDALTAAITNDGPFDAVLEIGPHPALKGPASDVIQDVLGKVLPYTGSLSRGKDDIEAWASAISTLWEHAGTSAVDFAALQHDVYPDAAEIRLLPGIPLYQWTHDRALWSEPKYSRLLREQPGKFHDILGTRMPDGTEEEWRWKNVLTTREIPWLVDHGLQGQTVLPATGYISLALEAALQIAEQRPVKLLELTDLTIKKAIAIDDSQGSDIMVTLTRIVYEKDLITALFACFSTITRDSTRLALNATGSVHVHLGKPLPDLLAPRREAVPGMVPVDPEHFFSELDKIGYNYGPTFRGINVLKRKLGFSSGTIKVPPNNLGTNLLFHPGMLDAALQGMLCGFSSPGDGRLWSLHAPLSVRRVSLVPSLCADNMTSDVYFDCAVTDTNYDNLTGDVDVFQSDTAHKSISVEGVRFGPFSAATAADDRHLFAHNRWDIEEPNGELAAEGRRATPQEIERAYDYERVSYYYLRTLRESVSVEERKDLQIPIHHEALFDYADHIYDQVQRGEHAYVQKSWDQDSFELIDEICKRYGHDDADIALTIAAGEAMPAVIRGETTILEHMTKDDKLDNYYKKALGFVELNRLMANTVKQISHRFARLNICEIGAGTGGATKGIVEKLDAAFDSYTYTDISSGFFPKAKENFGAQKDRFVFKTLDITVDPNEQGFIPNTYDLIVAANVLHATPDLVHTLKNVRRLLKPGGYLVMMEFTDLSPMRMGQIIGGLPGWWIGRESGRRYSPAATLSEWNDILGKSGFAVQTSTPVLDPVVMPACIITARAIDEEMTLLLEPLSAPVSQVSSSSPALVIIGGNSNESKSAIETIRTTLTSYYPKILTVETWDKLDPTSVPANSSVLSLSDIDAPFWKDIPESRFDKFKTTLLAASKVLWVSHGSDRKNPDGAMTYGFFRCLVYELPETPIQFLDLESHEQVKPAIIAKRLLSLEVSQKLRGLGSLDAKLWTLEPEVRIRAGQSLIPRLYREPEQNARYNSAKREITSEIAVRDSMLTLRWSGTKYDLVTEHPMVEPPRPGQRRVRVNTSLLSSLVTPIGRMFLSLGTDMDTKEQVLSVAARNSSTILVPEDWTIPVQVAVDNQYLSFLAGFLMSEYIASLITPGTALVAFEADPGLASLLSRKLSAKGCPVLFISTQEHMRIRRNWVYMHPRTLDRDISAVLPGARVLYLDLSGASPTDESHSLGLRIAKLLPDLSEVYDASLLLARESSKSTDMSSERLASLQHMLAKANGMAAAQLSGSPDGMPLLAEQVSKIIGDKDVSSEPMKIVQWTRDEYVPVRVRPITSRQDLFMPDKTYWLVGLAGDLGLSIANFMIQMGARNIALSSRNPQVDEPWVSEQKSKYGATIKYFKGDISEREDVRRVHREITSALPPIAGVANGALVLRDKGFVNMDLATFHQNTRCKVEGTEHLDEIFDAESNLDWFIAFSSISSTVGNMGQMAYASANSFMKALVAQRRDRGLPGSVIDISQVFGVGYVEREMKLGTTMTREAALRLMHRSGTIIMSETDLHHLFAEAIVAGRPGSGGDPEVITGIKTVTPDEARDALWGANVRFGHFIRAAGTASLPSAAKVAAVPVRVQLEGAKSDEQAMQILKKALIEKLKTSMMAQDESISDKTPLIDMGVDSLVAVEIRTWFAQEVGVDVAVLRILGGPSVEELVEDAIKKLKDAGDTTGSSPSVKSDEADTRERTSRDSNSVDESGGVSTSATSEDDEKQV
ncbi:hypothetical protein PFICI_00294 [Pestalotiopsis fici W106-1]|uniref:Carrier domain-containing protein n=1 Tax=Pestalotiopsis fici (strain W106-1 / CGMCC3.15140) TaxID=1229662 RepID=W3XMG0_PESFW|nr:uncharacterized protein PFICI_00294 [Pestalotiopsis fici W106-1]ETS86466.1 hypothetical protein PFICI_00294 [Pestalotiopsis fici W106-1]